MKFRLMLLRLTTTASLLLGASQLANAESRGGMDSGGAGLYGTDMNPWFLQNTPEVTYCLDVDPAAFHQSLEVVDQIILNAVESWKAVFAESGAKDRSSVQLFGIRIATQTFKRVPCDDTVDIRFQLGILTPQQKTQLGNYRQWIGASYRTSYNKKDLKGQGFVYIAADSGPEKPISADLVTDVWTKCDGCLLERTIVHELGHVFGMGHIGNDWDIMSERHLEKVTSQDWYNKHLTTDEGKAFFRERSALYGYLNFPQRYSAKDCTILAGDNKNRIRAIFDIPEDEQCVSFIRGRTNGCTAEQTIFAFQQGQAFNRYFIADECKDAGRSEVAWLYLPMEQAVLTFNKGKTPPVKIPLAIAYERTICSGSVYQVPAHAPANKNARCSEIKLRHEHVKTPISMSIITSRDGVFAGAAFEPNTERPAIFSSSMD